MGEGSERMGRRHVREEEGSVESRAFLPHMEAFTSNPIARIFCLYRDKGQSPLPLWNSQVVTMAATGLQAAAAAIQALQDSWHH